MFSLIKPFIFKIDPEAAHNLAIKSLKYNFLPEDVFKVDNEIILETKIFNTKIKNPIGLAAGSIKALKFIIHYLDLASDLLKQEHYPKQQYGNPKPRVFRLESDRSLINRLGFNNDGLEKVSNRLRTILQMVLGINIGPNKDNKNRVDDYLKCIKEISTFADYITINISSPNTQD